MNLITGLTYIILLFLLGIATRFIFLLLANRKDSSLVLNLEFWIHTFFHGILLTIITMNTLQFIPLSHDGLITVLISGIICSVTIVLIGLKFISIEWVWPRFSDYIAIAFVLLGSLLLYAMGSTLPNIGWDSWVVWEGKADQWINHGLASEIKTWNGWIADQEALFNPSANYPDGLSLLFFLPKLWIEQVFSSMRMIYVVAFALTSLALAKRLHALGASTALQIFLILVIYTTPLLGNHLLIIGYADIWIAMLLALLVMAYLDYYQFKTKGALITVVSYLVMLPMFKLEGWVWLVLFLLSHGLIQLSRHKKSTIGLIAVLFVVILMVTAGINFSTPLGQVTLNVEQITILSLIDTPISFNNVSHLLMSSLFWQNNWSLIWLGLPFVFLSFFNKNHSKPDQVIHLFFSLSILGFLFLFYFTKASQWAEDFTAINRITLQLTPCYLFLLFKLFIEMQDEHNEQEQTTN